MKYKRTKKEIEIIQTIREMDVGIGITTTDTTSVSFDDKDLEYMMKWYGLVTEDYKLSPEVKLRLYDYLGGMYVYDYEVDPDTFHQIQYNDIKEMIENGYFEPLIDEWGETNIFNNNYEWRNPKLNPYFLEGKDMKKYNNVKD